MKPLITIVKNSKHKVIINFFTYAIGDVIVKTIPFFLIPIVTSYLSVEEYGQISFSLTIIDILTIMVILGSHNYYRYKFFIENEDNLIFVPIFISLLVSLIGFLLFSSMNLLLSNYEFIDGMFIFPIVAFFQSISALAICRYQMEEKPKFVTLINISLATISAVSSIILLKLDFGYNGRLASIILTPVAVGAFILWRIFNKFRFSEIEYIKSSISSCVKFGIKSIPTSISWWLRSGMDRMVIQYFLGSASLGLYSLTSQLTLAISVLSIAINNSIMPTIFKKIHQGDVGIFKIIFLSLVFIAFSTGIYYATLPFIFKYFIPESYSSAQFLIFPLLLSVIFHGLFLFVSNIYVALNKPGFLSVISFSSAILHLMFSVLVSYNFGLYGIIWSGVFSFSVAIVMQLIGLHFFNLKRNMTVKEIINV